MELLGFVVVCCLALWGLWRGMVSGWSQRGDRANIDARPIARVFVGITS